MGCGLLHINIDLEQLKEISKLTELQSLFLAKMGQ